MIEIKSKQKFIETTYKCGYSLTQLAKKAKMSQGNLSNILSGRNGISPKKAKAIVEILNAEFDDLFFITAQINGTTSEEVKL